MLALKERLGLFENPYVDPDRAERVVNCAAHRELALQCARQSLVLLKNDPGKGGEGREPLPLSRDRVRTLALIGPPPRSARRSGNWWATTYGSCTHAAAT
ncbi:hypothetical protein ACFY1U_18770 [Streptomyces sp. NPDC001351]|uniref:hypothetical protein n=1 Tax=Streptomyces sp. NPDC001351 TaxID=3364564 RepID=UPI003677C5FF